MSRALAHGLCRTLELALGWAVLVAASHLSSWLL
jgi:hypothetical protein